jgi:hypothetical protein
MDFEENFRDLPYIGFFEWIFFNNNL